MEQLFKDALDLMFERFIADKAEGFWKPYIAGAVTGERFALEEVIAQLRGNAVETADPFIARMQARGENPGEYCGLVVLNHMPETIPENDAWPNKIVGNIPEFILPIRIEVIEGIKFRSEEKQ